MHIIIVSNYKRKAFIFIAVLVLWSLLFGFTELISKDKPVFQNYMNFQSKTGKFSFSYPSSFTLSQKIFNGNEILYHIDFHNYSNNSHGFVQVWNLPYPLEDFLAKSKSVSQQNFISFSSEPIKINKLPGYLWDYTIRTDDGKLYKGMEAFFKKENRMYRISYFTPANLWDKEQSDIFWYMVNSLRIDIHSIH